MPLDTQEIVDLCKKHTMYTWTASGSVNPLPIERAEGIYMYTTDGRKIIDFNSQLMSVNAGHHHPKIREAMKKQIDTLLYVYPGTATEPRARLAKKLADLVPGDINTFFFCLGGAEANENAIKAARQYTGRQKILSFYRSYHGATNACMQLTGDPRRLANEPGGPGFVHVMNPRPYNYSFGDSEERQTSENLQYLEEVIMYEGPDKIAAMFVETVIGTNGIQPPPAGYLQGLKKLLESNGILMVCDEVMCGFGRTGKMFAFEHYGFVPDILTMAKGLSSSYAPIAAMGVSDPIAAHFQDNVFWGGLTYNSHCLGCATAEANIDVLIEEGLVDNAVKMQSVMRKHMDDLQAKHPSMKEGRALGLFGMVDVQKNSAGEPYAPYNGKHPVMTELSKFFLDNGLFTFVRWSSFMCNPPLCITEEQLGEAFEILDRGLEITDNAFEG